MKAFPVYFMVVVALLTGCSEDPPSTTPQPQQPDTEMGGEDMKTEADSDPDSGTPDANGQRLVIQPVSGSGVVKSGKFRAHIQVGRLVDVSPGK